MTSKNMRIAIIDDEEIYRLFIGREMSELGFHSKTFECFEEFFEAIEGEYQDTFDVIIVDRIVGNEDSVRDRFAESCRQYGFSGAIILYSNYVKASEESNSLESSFERVLRKGELINWKKEVLDALNKRASRL